MEKKLIQSACSDSAEMLWKFDVVKGNTFTITNKKDQSVIDLSGSKTFKGNGLVSYKRNNSKSQRWNVQTIKKGQIIIKSEASGRCLDAKKLKNILVIEFGIVQRNPKANNLDYNMQDLHLLQK